MTEILVNEVRKMQDEAMARAASRSPRRVAVFGASGYIGSALVPFLCSLGCNVTAVDFAFQPHALRDACKYGNLRIEQADCRDIREIDQYIVQADVIYWLVGLTKGSEQDMTAVNISAARNLATMIWDSQTIVYPMTNAGYQTNSLATEDTPMVGKTPYSRSKIEGERILMNTGKCVSFRLAAVYGPAPVIRWETLLNYMIMHVAKNNGPFAMYEPNAVRDVLYIQDLVYRLALPLFTDLRGEVYNLTGASLRKREFFELVADTRLSTVHIQEVEGRDPDQRNFAVSEAKFCRKYDEVLGLPPLTLFTQDGIARTMNAARLEVL